MKLIINFSVCLLFLSFNSFSHDSIWTIKEYTYGKYGEDWYNLNGDRKADLVDLKHLIVRLNSYSSMREFDYKKYNLKKDDLFKEMYLVDDDKVYKGYYSWKQISKKIQLLFIFYLISFIPGVDFIGDKVYKFISKHRYKLE